MKASLQSFISTNRSSYRPKTDMPIPMEALLVICYHQLDLPTMIQRVGKKPYSSVFPPSTVSERLVCQRFSHSGYPTGIPNAELSAPSLSAQSQSTRTHRDFHFLVCPLNLPGSKKCSLQVMLAGLEGRLSDPIEMTLVTNPPSPLPPSHPNPR